MWFCLWPIATTGVLSEQRILEMCYCGAATGREQRRPRRNPAASTDPCLSHQPQLDGGKSWAACHRRRRAHRQGGRASDTERHRRLSGIRCAIRQQLLRPFAVCKCQREFDISSLPRRPREELRSEEHTSELQSIMRNSYAVL